MSASVSTKRALVTSFLVDLLDVVMNFTVAAITGSAVMIAEAMEGLADLSSVALLLVGHKRSQRKADHNYQFGYGKELYFWALLSAVVILLITASASFYFGLEKFLNPDHVEWTGLAYAVLAVAIATNGYAFTVSARALLGGRKFSKLPHVFFESSLLAPKTTVVLDIMGTLAALFGMISLIVYGLTGDGRFDGVGAMTIGVTLAVFAVILLNGVRGLITGHSVPPMLAKDIRAAAMKVPGVLGVLDLRTMILGATSTLVNLEIHLDDGLTTDEIEKVIDKVKREVGRVVPGYTHVQVEPETPVTPRKRKTTGR
ncbi:MAG TPA: cation diffusion facilitator family transporter [Candidatus Saccharimonadales bacterium]|nr:cation diffusion facilitator family transporter [Candidatus Saccharimonadales bacterium]